MYPQYHQMTLEDYDFPYGKLDPENEWVKLANLVPWSVAEAEYAEQFVNNGHPAHSVRIALGAPIIKQKLKCSNEWVVRHVSENPYLQFFLGMKAYTNNCPFGASTMIEFRTRFPPETIAALLKVSVPRDDDQKPDPPAGGRGGSKKDSKLENGGVLLIRHLMRSTKPLTFLRPQKDTVMTTASIPHRYWRTKSTALGRFWPGARNGIFK